MREIGGGSARASALATGIAAVLLLVAGCAERRPSGPPPASGTRLSEQEIRASEALSLREIYVPAYSHLSWSVGDRTMLAISLSVRNVDPEESVILAHVDYYDTHGDRVRRYVERPVRLRPLETAEFLVDVLDESGGSGANFLVGWRAAPRAHPLLAEAVMAGHAGAGHLSFLSRGVELVRPPEPVPAAPLE